MKSKTFSKLLGITLMSASIALSSSCSKGDNHSDPEGTVTVNMLNEINGKTILGQSGVFINKSQNFQTSTNLIADLGVVPGVGVRIDPRTTNLTREAAVVPGHAYQIFDSRTIFNFPSNTLAVQIETGFYQAYAVSLIKNQEEVTGAVMKYFLKYPDKKNLPDYEYNIGRVVYSGDKIEFDLPHDVECYFDYRRSSGDENAFEMTTDNNKLVITLVKSANSVVGPWGKYTIYLRQGSVYSAVVFNVLPD